MKSPCWNVWLLCGLMASVLPAGAVAEDWPRYGHDPALTGRSTLIGDIDAPEVAWTSSLAGRELLIELTPAGGERRRSESADRVRRRG